MNILPLISIYLTLGIVSFLWIAHIIDKSNEDFNYIAVLLVSLIFWPLYLPLVLYVYGD